MFALFSVKIIRAQTDPKLHPGESTKVTKMTLIKKPTDNNLNDSLVDVKIDYVAPDGSTGVLHLSNIRYSKSDSLRKPRITLEDGTVQEITEQEVRDWAMRIIQNPPDFVYYVNGIETTRDKIMKLDIATITTANALHSDEAVAKYGEKARKGVTTSLITPR